MTIAHELAERVTAMRFEDLPSEAVYWSRVGVLDTIGVTLAGACEPGPRIVHEALVGDARGPCLVVGTHRRAPALDAALVNGTAAHVLDFDNATNTMFGHASAAMLPALLAAGEAHGASGRDVLLAHVAGFETGARLGRALNMTHYEKGWHPTSTLGVFAVAAGCARLLRLSVEQTATALALATSLAAGIKANFGTMTKPLHAGQCARSGLQAVLLARRGFTASADAFEHQQGFFNVYNGAGHFDADRIFPGWGDPYDIVSPGACYKQYPCCASTHAAVDAALSLVREHGVFREAEIARIDTRTSPRRLVHTDRPQPATALDAKFSLQYCVARALVSGNVLFEHFEGNAHRDREVSPLLPRVHAAPYVPGEFGPDNDVGAEVKITLVNGKFMSARIERPLGRRSDNPIAADRMRAKFESCARRVLPNEKVEQLLARLESFESLESMRELTGLLEPTERSCV